MNVKTPITRSEELVPLSRDHHFGLLLCWKIKTGLNKNIDISRVIDYVLFFYRNHLEQHFAEEEQYIFPLLEESDTMIQQAILEHDVIRSLIAKLNDGERSVDLLKKLEKKLNDHIRFEERQLFPRIEQFASENELSDAGNIIAEIHRSNEEPVWDDEFWLNMK